MPYLGPRSFATAPLTKTNLAYLNDKLLESQQHPSSESSSATKLPTFSASSSITSSPEQEELSISTPLSTISSTSSLTELVVPSSSETIETQHQSDDDDNRTVIIDNATSSTASVSTIAELPSRLKLPRKKSGELVKSSLKLPSLKRSNSMPNAKSVRFANRLEDVKFFNKLEKPTAVSNESSPINSPSLRPSWEFDISSDEETDEEYLNEYWEIVENDVPHNPSFTNFGRFNSGKPIFLESLKMNSTKNSLIGFVYVKNIGYQKNIMLKLTFDNWKSYVEIESANYISSNHIFRYSDSEGSYDKFSFIIKLNELCSFRSSLKLDFCIKYEVNGVEYWDNNDSKNYHVSVNKIIKNSKPKLNSSIDLDDIKFKLKTNLNFNDSFHSPRYCPPTTSFLNQSSFGAKNSKQYLLRKVNSESSLATLNTPQPQEPALESSSSISAYSPSANRGREYNFGKASLNDNQLYDKLIENYCFFGSSSYMNDGRSDDVSEFSGELPSSFCLS